MLLSAENYRPNRPDGTIYRIDVNTAVVTAQVREVNDRLLDAIDAGVLTLSVREPTQSLVAALVFTTTDLVLNTNELYRFLNVLRSSFNNAPLEISVATGELAVSIEQYQPSAFMQQISYLVADLPE